MDAQLKAKWIEALRSGKYKQGQTHLLNGEKFCCLGVLLDIQGCSIEDTLPDLSDRCTSILPHGYSAGLTKKQRIDLANRNDGSAQYAASGISTFAEIADHIEQNL